MIGSNGKTAMGLVDTPLVIADEPGAWEVNKGGLMWDAITTAQGKPGSPLRVVVIGTLAPAEAGWWHDLIDAGPKGSTYVQALRGDPEKWDDWKEICRVNPLTRVSKEFKAKLKEERAEARDNPSAKARFLSYRLNVPTQDETAMLLDASLWAQHEGETERKGPCVWGVDLGENAAQSAVAAYYPETGRLEAVAAFPSEPTLQERGRKDGVGNLYVNCARRGELVLLGEATTDVKALLNVALDRFGIPAILVCDTWRFAELRQSLMDIEFPFTMPEKRRNGPHDGGEDVRYFRRSFAEGKVKPVQSLLLRLAMKEARTQRDTAGNSWLAKGSQAGRRQRARDDAVAASILAVSAGQRHRQVEVHERKEGENPFDRRFGA